MSIRIDACRPAKFQRPLSCVDFLHACFVQRLSSAKDALVNELTWATKCSTLCPVLSLRAKRQRCSG